MRQIRTTIVVLGLVLPLGLAACGSSSGTSSGTNGGGGASTTVAAGVGEPAAGGATISGYKFQIGAVTAGTALTVTNKDGVAHTFTSADGGVDARVPAGGSAQVTFAKAGTFTVVCKIHGSMKASVTVG